ncbi:hypothetical protein SET4581_16350 [Salmonella enterica subsp. enterica serovar Typhimurium str. ST4581]|nr:hypothetical protein SET4581_16350 [Salmonella enterica subsp. enterica serovar Typhimurium str. ST4581]
MTRNIYFGINFIKKTKNAKLHFFVYSWQLIYFNRVVFYYFDKK